MTIPLRWQHQDSHSSLAAMVSVLVKAGFLQESGSLLDGNRNGIRNTYSNKQTSSKSFFHPVLLVLQCVCPMEGPAVSFRIHSLNSVMQLPNAVSEPSDKLKVLLKILRLSEDRLNHKPAAPCILSSNLV